MENRWSKIAVGIVTSIGSVTLIGMFVFFSQFNSFATSVTGNFNRQEEINIAQTLTNQSILDALEALKDDLSERTFQRYTKEDALASEKLIDARIEITRLELELLIHLMVDKDN